MNTATQNLENDHVHILRLTDIMLAMVEKQSTNADHMELVLQLIGNFADGLHHAKEEEWLFPLLGEKGFSPEFGPVGVMLQEHEEGRHFVRAANEGLLQFKNGTADALQSVYENMSNYAYLLQGHIDKENNILFRMADQAFSSDEQQNLLTQFADIDTGTNPAFSAEKSKEKIDQLAAIYLQ